jgi:hypothetical protein
MMLEVVCIGEDTVRHTITVLGSFQLDNLPARMDEECGGHRVSFGVRGLEECPCRTA